MSQRTIKDTYIQMEEQAAIFGGIFTLANRLQLLGDKFDNEITTKQWLLIASISKHRNPPTISEVADQIGYSRQNVKKMATILEREGFLVLQRDTKDARILRMLLTEKCRNHFEQREAREQEFLDALFRNFDTLKLSGLYQGMTQLAMNVTEMEKQYEK